MRDLCSKKQDGNCYLLGTCYAGHFVPAPLLVDLFPKILHPV